MKCLKLERVFEREVVRLIENFAFGNSEFANLASENSANSGHVGKRIKYFENPPNSKIRIRFDCR